MQAFARLYRALDETTSTNAKVQAMADFFAHAPAGDAAWAVYFLSGRRPKRLIRSGTLRQWVRDEAGLPEWLLQECYDAVGDTAETIALLLPEMGAGEADDSPLAEWMHNLILPLRDAPEEVQRQRVTDAWARLDGHQRFVFNKLLTGAFRVGVSQKLLVRGLEAASGVDRRTLAHRLMGHWEPTPEFFRQLLNPDPGDAHRSRPYPFCLAHAILSEDVPALGPPEEWLAEWKWDGIRAQLIRRAGSTYLWSRGEELITDRYPEVAEAAGLLPDGTVLDGELLAFDDTVLPFAQLQRRIGRKKVGKKLVREVPVVMLAFDLLEWEGEDIREAPFTERRHLLQAAIPPAGAIRLSELVEGATWEEFAAQRAASRERLVEGLMLKRRDSIYHVGRVTGDWWKWKVAPFTVDAVLLYAQRGSGRRASLYTDYTFAVRDGEDLVPFAKAYSGLTDAEIREVDRWVRRNTRERFGPVRSVPPELVFEIAFEGIQRSTRHKSGIAVRFPRIARWRRDKTAADIDRLADVEKLIVEQP